MSCNLTWHWGLCSFARREGWGIWGIEWLSCFEGWGPNSRSPLRRSIAEMGEKAIVSLARLWSCSRIPDKNHVHFNINNIMYTKADLNLKNHLGYLCQNVKMTWSGNILSRSVYITNLFTCKTGKYMELCYRCYRVTGPLTETTAKLIMRNVQLSVLLWAEAKTW